MISHTTCFVPTSASTSRSQLWLRLWWLVLPRCSVLGTQPLLLSPQSSVLSPVLAQTSLPPLINICCGEDLTIRELAKTIAEVVGYSGKLVFDSSKPDGTMRKLMDVSRMKQMGWMASTSLHNGIFAAYQSYLKDAK